MLNTPKGEKYGYAAHLCNVGWCIDFIVRFVILIIPLDKNGNNVYNVVSIVDEAFIL